MESKESPYLDEYRIIKTLGSGYHAKVKLAETPDHQLVAIKRFKKETATLATLKQELAVMKQLHHENLVNLIDVRDNATYKKRSGQTMPCFAIIIEYAGGGELFDFIALGGRFSANVARTYFYQLMNGLAYMHERGYTHRDIKPENLLLTNDFVLKIADFGFATLLEGKDKTGVLHTKLGTDGYMAPEIQKKNYVGSQVDIFASGVILFIMYTASPPFERSVPEDPYYRLIKDKNYNTFWGFHSKRRPAGFFTNEFKDLINRMLSYDPTERPSMVEVAEHPWIKGQVLTLEQMKEEFLVRKKKVDEEAERQRAEKEKKKAQRNDALFNRNTLSRDEDQETLAFVENFETQANVSHKIKVRKNLAADDFVIEETEDYFYPAIMTFLTRKIALEEDLQVTPEAKIVDDKIHVTFTYEYESVEEKIVMEIAVAKTEKGQLCLNFSRVEGNQLYYKRLVVLVKNEFTYCAVKQ